MKTAVVMVTIGPDSWTRKYSVRRARAYAGRHGYEFHQIREPSRPGAGRTPHWEKLLAPQTLPGYERYFIIDDDLLINHRVAPALPAVPPADLGIVREPVPTAYPPPMRWLGNSGVLLFGPGAVDLIDRAYALGVLPDIEPGTGDQPAVNRVAWDAGRVKRLGWRWNFIPMADWLHTAHGQHHPWTPNRRLGQLAKLTLSLGIIGAGLGFAPQRGTLRRIRKAYAVHLVAYRMGAWLVDRHLG